MGEQGSWSLDDVGRAMRAVQPRAAELLNEPSSLSRLSREEPLMAARDDYPGLVAMTQDMEAADAWTHEAWAALAEIDRLRAAAADVVRMARQSWLEHDGGDDMPALIETLEHALIGVAERSH